MDSLWIALQFLTRLPTPSLGEMPPQLVGRSLAWYPLAGLLIGAILWGLSALFDGHATLLSATLLLVVWVGLTGALHLDGLADSADAWVGGLGDRERTLAIMKDPTSGPIGVTALVLLLLLKLAAIDALLQHGEGIALLLLPVLARSGAALFFITTPYVRAGGLGEALAQHAPRAWVIAGAVSASGLSVLLLQWMALPLLAALLLLWLLLRRAVLERLGGFTGDIAGALLELLECAALLVIALASHYI
jgi:adenosylcobinamide-GDP ribazoletransferase